MKCTDLLMQDHKIILRSLDVLQAMAIQVENGGRITSEDLETLLRFLRRFGDEHHHIKEESALFPELMRNAQAERGPLRHLLFEHDQERSLVGGLEEAIRTKKNAELVLFASRLAAGIRNHIRKEDSILFPIIDVLLSKNQDENIANEFDKFRIDIGLLGDLHRLEWTYLRKTADVQQAAKTASSSST
jgi:hemerythrin-like domain-containing protein